MGDYGDSSSTARTEPSEQKTYSEFLELPLLLSLQKPTAEPPVHDEMLFLVVHQAHELWFKQMIFELRALIAHIDDRAWQLAERLTDRLARLAGILILQVDVFETMPAEEFQRFRGVFGSASGLQSEQYKLIGELAGEDGPVSSRTLPVRAGSPSVRVAFSRAIASRISAGGGALMSREEAGLGELFRDPAWADERRVAERLLHFDAEMLRWRARHLEIARALVGAATGTGGSSGARYLERRLDRRYFPELWAARAAAT